MIAALDLVEQIGGEICALHRPSAFRLRADFDPIALPRAAVEQSRRTSDRPFDVAGAYEALHGRRVRDMSRQHELEDLDDRIPAGKEEALRDDEATANASAVHRIKHGARRVAQQARIAARSLPET